jgi:hypothetical protein
MIENVKPIYYFQRMSPFSLQELLEDELFKWAKVEWIPEIK